MRQWHASSRNKRKKIKGSTTIRAPYDLQEYASIILVNGAIQYVAIERRDKSIKKLDSQEEISGITSKIGMIDLSSQRVFKIRSASNARGLCISVRLKNKNVVN